MKGKGNKESIFNFCRESDSCRFLQKGRKAELALPYSFDFLIHGQKKSPLHTVMFVKNDKDKISKVFWTQGLPDGVHSIRPCPSVSPSVSPYIFIYFESECIYNVFTVEECNLSTVSL